MLLLLHNGTYDKVGGYQKCCTTCQGGDTKIILTLRTLWCLIGLVCFSFLFFFCTFIVIIDFISKYFFKKDCNKFKIFQVNHFSSQSESSNSTFFFFFFQALLKFLPIFSICLFSPILNYFQWFFKMFSKFVSLINV